jgi:hypothetical protein
MVGCGESELDRSGQHSEFKRMVTLAARVHCNLEFVFRRITFGSVDFVQKFSEFFGHDKLGDSSRAMSLKPFRIRLGVSAALVAILCLIGALTLE